MMQLTLTREKLAIRLEAFCDEHGNLLIADAEHWLEEIAHFQLEQEALKRQAAKFHFRWLHVDEQVFRHELEDGASIYFRDAIAVADCWLADRLLTSKEHLQLQSIELPDASQQHIILYE